MGLLAIVGTLTWAVGAGGTQPYDTYQGTVAADGPVAQYRFNDAAGSSTIADSAGSFTATNSGIALGGEGPFSGSKSGSFGSEAYASLPSNPIEGASAFTAEAWVNWTGGASYNQPIFDFGTGVVNMYLTPAAEATNHPLTFEIRGTPLVGFKVAGPELTANAWAYVAVTETGSGTLTLYLNGQQVGQTTGALLNPSSLLKTLNNSLGKPQLPTDPLFRGKLSNVAFYTKALSSSRILAHYNAGEFPVNTSPPTVTGTAEDEHTLSAGTGTWTGLAPITYSYQWQRCGAQTIGSEGSGPGQLKTPEGIAVDPHGNVWVSDTYNGRLEVFGDDGKYLKTVGSPGSEPGQIGESEGVAIDSHSNVWVADWLNNRVDEFNEKGEFVRQFGSKGTGNGQFENPFGIAADSAGNVWVGDFGNNRVEEFNEKGEYLSQVGSAGSGAGQFNFGVPMGLAIDAKNNIWVADSNNNRVQEFNAKGEYLSQFGSVGSAAGQLKHPGGLAFDAKGNLWVADVENNRVEEFNAKGEFIRQVGSEGSGVGQFKEPYGVAINTEKGHVWVVDTHNARVEEFNELGETLGVKSCADITGATGATYPLVPADVGKSVRVTITATNAAGEGSAPSAETATVKAAPPANTSPPAISGTAQDEQTLSTSTGTWKGTPTLSYAYQWQSCSSIGGSCANISGATSSTYVVGHGDVGTTVKVVVTASNAVGSASSTSAASAAVAPLAPSSATLPAISGTAVDGQMLTVSNGEWNGTPPLTYAYQWKACDSSGANCQQIAGANGSNYRVTTSQLGKTLRSVVTATNAAGSANATSEATATIVPGPPVNTALPTITGTPKDGQTLSASTGTWAGTPPISYAYQWQRCSASGTECANVTGATTQTYTLGDGDVAKSLRVQVTASNAQGSASAVSSPTSEVLPPPPTNTAPPTISGLTRDGQKLTAGVGSWSSVTPVSYSYQWESCNPSGGECAPIEYATLAEYELGEGDIGTTLRVVVTASNAGGSTTATSVPSAGIEAEPTSELKPPSISGTPDVHNVLYANEGLWTGTETHISYQWESCNPQGTACAPVEGATEPEYDLAEGDIGTTVRVRVGAAGRSAALTDVSSSTPVVGADGVLTNTSPPSISGVPRSGTSLTATAGAWSETQAVTYGYQWQRCDRFGGHCEVIEAATSSGYTPQANSVGNTLRVVVTATGGHGSASQASAATQTVAAVEAPAIESPPVITGTLLQGATLSATTGRWSGSGPISYSYQWERCAEATQCTAVEGATASSYAPTGTDVGSTLLVLVTATNSAGSSAGVSRATSVIEPQSLVKFSAPSITGVVELAGTLTAEPGIWTGSGRVSFAYQWESCNPQGAACAPVKGATEPSYVIATGDLGSTLRVAVTTTAPSGSQTAPSAPTVVVPGAELSVEAAQEVAQQSDPAMLARSTSATVEAKTITPALSDVGEQLNSQSTLTTSSISKDSAGEWAVNTPDGELVLVPVGASPKATSTPTVVNGTAALFANTWPATDTVIRAEPLGATELLDLRSTEAPTSFSWEVRLSSEQQLKQLSNGAIAVIQATEAPPEASGKRPEAEEPNPAGTSSMEGQPPTSAEKAERAYEESLPETGEEVPLESLPASPQTSTAMAEAKPGEPQPQQTQAEYELGASVMAAAEAQTGGTTLMVIEPPTVVGATGSPVPASVRVSGSTVTMTIGPAANMTFPGIAAIAIVAPTDKVSAERDPVSYGLADQQPATFAKDQTGQLSAGVAKLRSNLNMKTARLFVSYDALLAKTQKREAAEVQQNKKPMTETTRIATWLTAVEHAELTPYITLTKDAVTDPCVLQHPACPTVSTTTYRAGVDALVKHYGSVVKDWGSWNEPDLGKDPLRHTPELAAQLWEIAHSVVAEKRMHCNRCRVVAGEFAFDNGYAPKTHYVSRYRNELLCRRGQPHCTRYGSGKPSIWGFHDYSDVKSHTTAALNAMVKVTSGRRVGTPQLWIGEAGVLQTGEQFPFDGLTPGQREEQRESAKAFLNLRSPRLARAYYFSYHQPTEAAREARQGEPVFDSGLFEVNGEGGFYKNKGEARPAYCVLAFQDQSCKPTAVTLHRGEEGVFLSEVGRVTPNGLSTEAWFESGREGEPYNPSYTSRPRAIGAGLAPVVVWSREGPGCPPSHYRVVARNAEGTVFGQDAVEPNHCV